jgi:hypothetical protein
MRSARERWHRVAVLALIVSSGCGEEEPTGAAPDAGPPAASTCWSFTGPMHQRRVGADAVVLADGRVLVVGGYDVAAHASAEVYDSTSGVWTEVAPMHFARMFPAAVLLEDGRVLVPDGRLFFTGSQDSFYFDPSSETWQRRAPKLGTEGGVHVALRDGRILSPWSAGTARQPGRVGGPLAPIAFGPGFG